MKYLSVLGIVALLGLSAPAAEFGEEPVVLRAWGVPGSDRFDVSAQSVRAILAKFRERYPHVRVTPDTGINIIGRRRDVTTLMQIAGDVAPDVLYINFRSSHTQIANRFLYPLDKYVEAAAGVDIPDGHLLDTETYLERLREGPNYEREIGDRVPDRLWKVIRRRSPFGKDSPWVRAFGGTPAEEHYHIFAWPVGPVTTVMFYDRELFAEHGLPDRPPEDWDELLEFARAIHNPRRNQYGFRMPPAAAAYTSMNFVYSMGGRLVDRDEDGEWRLVFNSPEAVEAYLFTARMLAEPFTNAYGTFEGCVTEIDAAAGFPVRFGMFTASLDEQFFSRDPELYGFGPVPRGPTGIRGNEFNSRMLGIYAGLEGPENTAKRDAAWAYIHFRDSAEARRERARVFVENGMGRFIRPSVLRDAGFHSYADRVPPAWEETLRESLESGVPEPYGKNCQMVYRYIEAALSQVGADPVVRQALREGEYDTARDQIQIIMDAAVARGNEKMLDRIPEDVMAFRKTVSVIVAVLILGVFMAVFRYVFKAFTEHVEPGAGKWLFSRLKWAYILLGPALISLAVWNYYPLLRGTVMAFQDYNVRGYSEMVGMENFARVLFDAEFWYAMWVTLKYSILFVLFGFWTPIALAFMLSELPRGSVFFRVVYYLPAMLTGVVGMFLWRGFFGAYGAVSQVINGMRSLLSLLPFFDLEPLYVNWLNHPRYALPAILAPVIWGGIGPGCLIYLAALKTIPEEIYEAADIDGAGFLSKALHIAVPNIKALIMINFIGVLIAQMQGNAAFVLAMTGGGPFVPYGATEVIGLHIFFQAFGYLRFGIATAMAWILGALLIGFTVLRLKRLANMEFRTAQKG